MVTHSIPLIALLAPLLACSADGGESHVVGLEAGTPVRAFDESAPAWPQWRGPARDGISRETEWGNTGKTVWSQDLGLGYAAVSVAGGRLYTSGHDAEAQEDTVWCLDPASGEVQWSHSFPSETLKMAHEGGTLTTPSVEGDRVWVLHRQGKFLTLDAASGEVMRERNLRTDLDLGEVPTWGYSASPLVLEEGLVLNLGHVVSLDKVTGEVHWRTERDYGHAYSTPTTFELPRKDGEPRACLGVFAGDGFAVLDRDTGDELAFHEWKTNYDINAATPIAFGTLVFLSSGYNHGCVLLDLAQVADGGEATVVWESKVMRNKMSGCVLIDGFLYGFDESTLKCVEAASGREAWAERGTGMGALSAAGDRILAVTGKGELLVVAANPKKYEELARADVIDGGVFWTMPVLVDGRVYVRSNRGQLACRDHRIGGDGE